MAIKHTILTTIKNDAGASVIADTEILTADAESNFSVSAAGSNAVTTVDLVVTVADIQSFFVESSQAVDLKTYSGVTLKQTIPLAAKKAFAWNANDTVNVNPLTDDFDSLTITNAGTTTATVVGGFLLNL